MNWLDSVLAISMGIFWKSDNKLGSLPVVDVARSALYFFITLQQQTHLSHPTHSFHLNILLIIMSQSQKTYRRPSPSAGHVAELTVKKRKIYEIVNENTCGIPDEIWGEILGFSDIRDIIKLRMVWRYSEPLVTMALGRITQLKLSSLLPDIPRDPLLRLAPLLKKLDYINTDTKKCQKIKDSDEMSDWVQLMGSWVRKLPCYHENRLVVDAHPALLEMENDVSTWMLFMEMPEIIRATRLPIGNDSPSCVMGYQLAWATKMESLFIIQDEYNDDDDDDDDDQQGRSPLCYMHPLDLPLLKRLVIKSIYFKHDFPLYSQSYAPDQLEFFLEGPEKLQVLKLMDFDSNNCNFWPMITRDCKSLRDLQLVGVDDIDDETLSKLHASNIETITIDNCPNVSANGLAEFINRCEKLRYITLGALWIHDARESMPLGIGLAEYMRKKLKARNPLHQREIDSLLSKL